MFASREVLLDVACTSRVRAAVQAVFPGIRLGILDIEAATREDRVALSRAHAVVLGLRSWQGAPTTPVIELLRAIAPHVGIFVVEEGSGELNQWLPRLAVSGADDAFALDRAGR